jgi:hypothetical protein
MTRAYLLVEGQTEEAFVNELLVPHYARIALYLTPIIVSTSRGHKGGVVSYAKIKPQIERLCKQDVAAYVTTMFDLYALPEDFPGKRNLNHSGIVDGRRKAEFLEAACALDIGRSHFIPHLQVHEFEALLFTQLDALAQWTDDHDHAVESLREVRRISLPEEINDGPTTAPSKRILAAMPGYQKPFHGPLIACDIGLDAMRQNCPHFDAWLKKLEALA